MIKTFRDLCHLWSALDQCQLKGEYPLAMLIFIQIRAIERNHPVIGFYAKHLYRFYGGEK